jgi:methyl-accepting chemotaxis protein
MKSIKNILLLGLAAIALLFLVQAWLLYSGQQQIQREVISAAQKNTQASAQLSELAILAQQVRRYEKEYFVYVNNVERRENYIKEWTGTSDKITKLLQSIRSNAQGAFTPEDLAKVSNWSSAAEFYSSEMKKIFGAVNDRQTATPSSPPSAKDAPPANTSFAPAEANVLITAGKDRLSGVLIKGVSDLYQAKTKATLELDDVATATFSKLAKAVGATVLIGFLLALFLAWRLPRAITSPLGALTDAVDRMSKGDLEKAVDVGGVHEFSGLSTALERMRVAQKTLMQRLRTPRP